MRPHRFFVPIALVALLAFAGNALAIRVTDPEYPRSLEREGPVSVAWSDPAGFSEVRYSGNRFEAVRGDWVRDLAGYVAERAEAALAPGERLEVTITDIDRAGEYEPAGIDRVRIVRDLYPPRIELRYTLFGADGNVASDRTRKLTDIGYLHRGIGRARASDPLRYEKRLVDDWVRSDFADRNS